MSDSEEYIIPVNKPKRVVIKRDKKIILTTKNEMERKREEEEVKIKKKQQRKNILQSKLDKEEIMGVRGKQFIYPNQKEAADKCIEEYKNGAVAVCLIAPPGVGKTGTAQEVMIQMATNPDDEEIIYSENIINFTGMSDNDWETQFKNSVLLPFKDNIFHRQNLIKQKNKLESLKQYPMVVADFSTEHWGSSSWMVDTLSNRRSDNVSRVLRVERSRNSGSRPPRIN